MKKVIFFIFVLVTLSPTFAGGQKEEVKKPVIAVSIVPQATFVEKIAGDKVDIVTLIPKGSSPENYEPTPKQRMEFEKADIYFTIGVPSEKHYILDMVGKNTKVVDLAAEIEKKHPPIYIGDTKDPHIWLSPKRVVTMIDIMREEIAAIDYKNVGFYRDNSQSYKAKVYQVSKRISSSLTSAIDSNRSFLVYHPAFNYFADDFNLTMYAIEEEGKEVTPKTLIATLEMAKEKGIKNIYYQAEISAEESIEFSKELGGKAILLDPLSPNYIENLEIMANIFKENL